jgi:nucleotide-binding universal stress UspA family protein
MFQRLLICTDLTDGLQRLVHFVPSLAAGGIQQVVFLHVVPLGEGVGVPRPDSEKLIQAQAKLAPALQQNDLEIEVKVEIQSGRAIDTILRTARTYGSDVILMGTQSRDLLTEKLFGSTTAGLAQRTPIPVLTLRPQMIATYTAEELDLRCRHLFRDLLIPYDDSEAARHAVEQIQHLAAKQMSSALRSCHICWVIGAGGRFELSAQEEQEQVCKTLEPVRDRLQATGLTVNLSVRRGNPITEVLQAARSLDISAIALSSNNLNPLLGSVPSFAAELLRRSWHPVLFFPPKRS